MTESTTIVPHSLDDYFQSTPIGSLDKAIGNNLYGLNHRQIPNAVPSNRDNYGLTFFVRPQLNMQADNLRNLRQFYPLLTTNDTSIQRFVRCTLDPRMMHGYSFGGSKSGKVPPIACPIVDELNAFIPVLTNNLKSISGWPDVVAPTFTSAPGMYNENFSMVDGITRNYEAYDMDATFRNTRGDPILYLFYIWLHYSSFVFEGKLVPYLDFITENEIDYNTRIYRLVLDRERNKVTKIAATGASFPVSIPTGSFFDFSAEKPFNDQNNDITIRFKCLGVDYQDDITIREFNRTVEIFNPSMRSGTRESTMMPVQKNVLALFNNRGYPRIDENTYELQWWVPQWLYQQRTQLFLQNNLAGNILSNSSLVNNSTDQFTGD